MAQEDLDEFAEDDQTKSKVIHVRVDQETWRRMRREVLRVDKKPSDWIRSSLIAALDGPKRIEGLVREALLHAFETPDTITAAVASIKGAEGARAEQEARAAELAERKIEAERAAKDASAKAERARRAALEASEAEEAARAALDRVSADIVKKVMESK
jgi:membrane protein involved in colicin uptake